MKKFKISFEEKEEKISTIYIKAKDSASAIEVAKVVARHIGSRDETCVVDMALTDFLVE